jgi:hypothetical protein
VLWIFSLHEVVHDKKSEATVSGSIAETQWSTEEKTKPRVCDLSIRRPEILVLAIDWPLGVHTSQDVS